MNACPYFGVICKKSHCQTTYKIISWNLISHGFLLLFFKGVFGFKSILLIDPHVLMSETVMFVALKYCFVNMTVILKYERYIKIWALY
jgi:hypothetical protein